MKKIFILTGEPSGDKLASKVIQEFKKDNAKIEYLSVGGENLKALGINKTFEDLQPGREDVTGFDSISYISTDFAKMLSMYYGLDFDGTHFIFKPIISSNKTGKNMYGKTVFIHDPTIQHVFSKNQGLDVLLAKSGAKIGAGSDETFGQTMIQKHTDILHI